MSVIIKKMEKINLIMGKIIIFLFDNPLRAGIAMAILICGVSISKFGFSVDALKGTAAYSFIIIMFFGPVVFLLLRIGEDDFDNAFPRFILSYICSCLAIWLPVLVLKYIV